MVSYLFIYQLTIEFRGFRIKDISDCISSSYNKSEISVNKIRPGMVWLRNLNLWLRWSILHHLRYISGKKNSSVCSLLNNSYILSALGGLHYPC